jgi:hypothetical protein
MSGLEYLDLTSNSGIGGVIPELLYNKFLMEEAHERDGAGFDGSVFGLDYEGTSVVPPTTERTCEDGIELYLAYVFRRGFVNEDFVYAVECNGLSSPENRRPIPTWIGRLDYLTHLQRLVLAGHYVQGTLPTELGELSAVEHL